MSKPKSFKESLVDWQTMADNVAVHLDEMPHLRELRDSLAALADRAQALQAQREVYAANLREVNRERAVTLAAGRDLRIRLAFALQAVLGVHSERLVEFGVLPRPRFARRHRLRKADKAAAARAAGKNDPASVN